MGFFWLLVVVLFEDRKVTPITMAPAAVLIVLSVLAGMTRPPADQLIWDARDLAAGGIAIHAAVVILRGWRGDLVDARRRLRGPLLVAVALYIVAEALVGMAIRLGHGGD